MEAETKIERSYHLESELGGQRNENINFDFHSLKFKISCFVSFEMFVCFLILKVTQRVPDYSLCCVSGLTGNYCCKICVTWTH